MSNLSNDEIDWALSKVPHAWNMYAGAYAHDQLPHVNLTHVPAFLVINTDSHNLPGRHWISIYIDANRRCEVFDPLASPPSNHVVRFMNRWSRQWVTNNNMYQHPLSSACGVFVLYHLVNRHCYPSLSALLQTLSPNLLENEIIMSAFYRRLE